MRMCLTLLAVFLESNVLHWCRVYQVPVYGSPATMGGHRGFRGLAKRENSSIEINQCVIRWYFFESETLLPSFEAVSSMLSKS